MASGPYVGACMSVRGVCWCPLNDPNLGDGGGCRDRGGTSKSALFQQPPRGWPSLGLPVGNLNLPIPVPRPKKLPQGEGLDNWKFSQYLLI